MENCCIWFIAEISSILTVLLCPLSGASAMIGDSDIIMVDMIAVADRERYRVIEIGQSSTGILGLDASTAIRPPRNGSVSQLLELQS